MFIPIGFDAPKGRQPIVTYVLVAACTLIWLGSMNPFEHAWSRSMVAWTGDVAGLKAELKKELDALPEEARAKATAEAQGLIELVDSSEPWTSRPWTLLTCTFLHGDFFHLLGNMLFLFVFGRAVNSWLGTVRYLALYVLLGVIASLGHALFSADNFSGLVGASGAISGVMGLALALFPRHKVRIFYWLRFRAGTFEIAAFWALIFWFGWDLIQLLLLSPKGGGGVAFMAHIMGFLAGAGAGALMLGCGLTERHDLDLLASLGMRPAGPRGLNRERLESPDDVAEPRQVRMRYYDPRNERPRDGDQ
jgi:rhomboid family protein